MISEMKVQMGFIRAKFIDNVKERRYWYGGLMSD